jgi:hypothetical protein
MSKYYIVDSTVKQNGKNPVMLFESIPSAIKYMEQMCERQFKLSRADYMNRAESVGHSADEPTGRAFYEMMEQYFNIGVIRKDSSPVKCNIFEADRFIRSKDVHGN